MKYDGGNSLLWGCFAASGRDSTLIEAIGLKVEVKPEVDF